MMKSLGSGYWIEVAEEKKSAEMFSSADAFWEFTKADDWRYYSFIISRVYTPGDNDISSEGIAPTLTTEAKKFVVLYKYLKAPVKN